MKQENIEIRVFKSQKRLEIWDETQCVQHFSIGIGKNPVGTKEVEGDFKTPEGQYEICVKNPESKFYLSVGLNYPNQLDAKRGLDQGRITQATYQKICEAIKNKTIPPWNTSLGGEIYIHGELEDRDWSEGCIRMNRDDIHTLYQLTQKGTRVTIYA